MLDSKRMRGLRTHLRSAAAAWLFVQVAALSAAPVVFAATATLVAADGCECPDAASGGSCPMHHDVTSTGDETTACHMRGSCAAADVALLALAGGAGVLSQPMACAQDPVVSYVRPVRATLVSQSDVPDSPPPRS